MTTLTKICLHFSVIFLALLPSTFDESVETNRIKLHNKIDVMTRNLYNGADISSFFAAQENPELLSVWVRQVYDAIVHPESSHRAKAIALEIAQNRPDVVALQQVYKVCKDESDFLTYPMDNIRSVTGEITPNATSIAFDYLQLLIDELKALELHYFVAASQDLTDAELPAMLDEGLFDIRITDRNVILVRKGVNASNPVAYLYDTTLPFTFAAPGEVSADADSLVIYFTRGFVAADVTLRGNSYQVVNTLLETRLEALGPLAQYFQIGQAMELIAAIEDRPLPVILLGEFNSSAEDPIIPIDEYNTIIPPYKLLQLNGYIDVCASRLNQRHTEGLTFCQDSDLSDTVSELFARIGLIWVKNMPRVWPYAISETIFASAVIDRLCPVSIASDKEIVRPSIIPSFQRF